MRNSSGYVISVRGSIPSSVSVLVSKAHAEGLLANHDKQASQTLGSGKEDQAIAGDVREAK